MQTEPHGESVANIHGNQVRLRRVEGHSDTNVLGFVHNPESDAAALLALAAEKLAATERQVCASANVEPPG